MRRIVGLVVVALVALVATVAQAHTGAGHRIARTTAPDTYVNIKVTMTDTKFTLSRHEGPQGSDARFIIRNIGTKPHAFQLGRQEHGQGFQSGFNATVNPGQKKILILYLDYRGAKVPYFGSMAADRHDKRMQGTFIVGKCLKASYASIDSCNG